MASLNIPNVFSNNSIADATQVNANFNEVKSFAETKVVQIDGSVKAPTAAIADLAVTNGKIADDAVTSAKILNGSITNTKVDYNSVPRTTVSNVGPSGGKDGDIWVRV